MAVARVSSYLNLSISEIRSPKLLKLPTVSRIPTSNFARDATSFVRGTPLVIHRSSTQLKAAAKANLAFIRCEQSANESNSLDVWLGRLAMVGFAVAITVEISTGKGLLENFGLIAMWPW